MKKNNISLEKNEIIKLFNEKKFIKISKNSKNLLANYTNDIDIWKLVIFSEINLNNSNKAEKYSEKLISFEKSKETYYLYGNVLKIQKKYKQSILAFEKSIELDNNFSEAYNNLANVQKQIGLVDEALLNYEKSILKNKNNIQAYFNLANLFKFKKKFELAIKNYNKVIEIDSKFVEAYSNIGQIYATLGKFEEAEKYFKIVIKKHAKHLETYKNYFSLKKIDTNDEIYLKLLKVVTEKNLSNFEKQHIYYSMGKVSLDIGNDDEAFKYLDKANSLKLQDIKFSIKKIKKDFKRTKKIFSKKYQDKIYQNQFSSYPIFILGMPRSGTTLLEQIISNHSEVYGGGELDFLPTAIKLNENQIENNLELALDKIRQNYLLNLNKLSKNNLITDKLPANFKHIGIILEAIPEAKIIHICRNPMAVCWSNYKSNFLNNGGMEYSHKQEDIAEFYIEYHELMLFWNKKYSGKIINLDYEKLVQNFNEEIKNLFLKLDLKWEHKVLEFYKNNRAVETASFMQVRNKIYKDSSEQWKKYKKYLKPMMNILNSNNIKFQ